MFRLIVRGVGESTVIARCERSVMRIFSPEAYSAAGITMWKSVPFSLSATPSPAPPQFITR